MPRKSVSALLLMCLFAAGCGTPPVPTHEVKGTVLLKSGEPLGEGGVEFQHKTDPRCNCTGALDKNGNFTLSTLAGTQLLRGAAEGEYDVVVHLPMGDDQRARSVKMKETQVVKAGTNTIRLDLDELP